MISMLSSSHAMSASISARQGSAGAVLSRLATPCVAAVTLRWDISPRAMVAAGAGARLLNGHAATLKTCALMLHVQGLDGQGPCLVHARLELAQSGGRKDAIPLTELPGVLATLDVDSETGYLNVDAPGLLSLTLRARGAGAGRGGNVPALRFARSALLADRFGLPGGVYDAPVLEPG